MLLRRIVLLYIVLLLCRIVFYCYNYALIGPLGWQEVLTLAGGGLKFDTVSVLYANLLFIVLSLLPFHFRERSWYRRILFWYYAVINSLLIVAVNLADCVYFRYTQKRFTADEIFFADNSNSVQLVLKFAAETGTCSSSAQSSSGCSFGVTDARSHPDRPCARAGFITRSIQDCW